MKLTVILTVLINFYQCAVINVTQLSTGLTLSFDQTKGLLVLVPTSTQAPDQSQEQKGVNTNQNSFISLFRGAQNYYGQNPMLWHLQNIPKINPKNSSSDTVKDTASNTTSNKTIVTEIIKNVSEIEGKNEDSHLLDFNTTQQNKNVSQQKNQLNQTNELENKENDQITQQNVITNQTESKGNTSQSDQELPLINVISTVNGTFGKEQTGNVSKIEEGQSEKEQNKTLESLNIENNASTILPKFTFENNTDSQEINAAKESQTILPQLEEQIIQDQHKVEAEVNHETKNTTMDKNQASDKND